MRKCKNCRVAILDDTRVCPLCHSVLEVDERQAVEEQKSIPGMYPDVKKVTRKMNFIVKLYTFLAIVAEATLIVINYATFSGLWWSAISGVGILYFYITLRHSIQKNSGYLSTILTQIIAGVILTVALDFILGYRGWSVNFVIPSAILLMDLTILILMLVNMQNWQSYILLQIFTVLLSIMTLLFWKAEIIKYPIVTIVARRFPE